MYRRKYNLETKNGTGIRRVFVPMSHIDIDRIL